MTSKQFFKAVCEGWSLHNKQTEYSQLIMSPTHDSNHYITLTLTVILRFPTLTLILGQVQSPISANPGLRVNPELLSKCTDKDLNNQTRNVPVICFVNT